MEMHYVSFNKMVNNNTDSIRFDTLYGLSKILEVPVGDLFECTDESDFSTNENCSPDSK